MIWEQVTGTLFEIDRRIRLKELRKPTKTLSKHYSGWRFKPRPLQ